MTILNAVSTKFQHIGINGMKIIFELIRNQNFLRYIKYLDVSNPLDKNLPDIPCSGIINDGKNDGCIYPLPFSDKILIETSVILFFNPHLPNRLQNIVSEDVYTLDIIVPNQYWYIYSIGAWRPYLIIYEVAQSIDRKRIAGLGDVEIIKVSTPYKAADGYSGVTIFIKVNSSTIK